MSGTKPILLAAGGTGGHLFPAEALAAVLAQLGFAVELVTDERALKYGAAFPARAIHAIPAATPTGGSVLGKAGAALVLARGTFAAWRLLGRIKPGVVVGFGGYPTVPPLLAAAQRGIPTILHEQNAVIGRANKFLAKRVRLIATGFPELGGIDGSIRAKTRHTGNPVRPAVIAASSVPYPAFADGRMQVLVTGGSQGARVMSDIVPMAIELLPADARARLHLVQQARGEDEARVSAVYARLGLACEVKPFFADLPGKLAASHLVIARSGASTVSELAVVGRPAILVPFPFALDNDQAANAAELAKTGAVTVIKQSEFTANWLAGELMAALADPGALKSRALAARQAGIADAAERLADLVTEAAG